MCLKPLTSAVYIQFKRMHTGRVKRVKRKILTRYQKTVSDTGNKYCIQIYGFTGENYLCVVTAQWKPCAKCGRSHLGGSGCERWNVHISLLREQRYMSIKSWKYFSTNCRRIRSCTIWILFKIIYRIYSGFIF